MIAGLRRLFTQAVTQNHKLPVGQWNLKKSSQSKDLEASILHIGIERLDEIPRCRGLHRSLPVPVISVENISVLVHVGVAVSQTEPRPYNQTNWKGTIFSHRYFGEPSIQFEIIEDVWGTIGWGFLDLVEVKAMETGMTATINIWPAGRLTIFIKKAPPIGVSITLPRLTVPAEANFDSVIAILKLGEQCIETFPSLRDSDGQFVFWKDPVLFGYVGSQLIIEFKSSATPSTRFGHCRVDLSSILAGGKLEGAFEVTRDETARWRRSSSNRQSGFSIHVCAETRKVEICNHETSVRRLADEMQKQKCLCFGVLGTAQAAEAAVVQCFQADEAGGIFRDQKKMLVAFHDAVAGIAGYACEVSSPASRDQALVDRSAALTALAQCRNAYLAAATEASCVRQTAKRICEIIALSGIIKALNLSLEIEDYAAVTERCKRTLSEHQVEVKVSLEAGDQTLRKRGTRKQRLEELRQLQHAIEESQERIEAMETDVKDLLRNAIRAARGTKLRGLSPTEVGDITVAILKLVSEIRTKAKFALGVARQCRLETKLSEQKREKTKQRKAEKYQSKVESRKSKWLQGEQRRRALARLEREEMKVRFREDQARFRAVFAGELLAPPITLLRGIDALEGATTDFGDRTRRRSLTAPALRVSIASMRDSDYADVDPNTFLSKAATEDAGLSNAPSPHNEFLRAWRTPSSFERCCTFFGCGTQASTAATQGCVEET